MERLQKMSSFRFVSTVSPNVVGSFGFKKVDTNTVTDIDGNVYSTVKLGNQYWMQENLKVTKLNDGTPIPEVIDNTDWSNLSSIGRYSRWGQIYNGYATQSNKLAPAGWHVPTTSDWNILLSQQWPPAQFLMETSGFNATRCGYRDSNGEILGGYVDFSYWGDDLYYYYWCQWYNDVFRYGGPGDDPRNGRELRCIKD